MARGLYFTIRGNRRSKLNRNRNRNKKLQCIILAAVLLLMGTRFALQYKLEPVVAVEDSAGTTTYSFFMETIYKRIVSFAIPGISDDVIVSVTGSDNDYVDENAMYKVGLPNLRDPKLIVLAQLPFLSDPGIVPQPLVDEEPDNTVKPPRITIPVRHELTGVGKVIIYHTHATESFLPTSGKTFTQDLSLTVVQLGKELAESLQRNYQIPVIHNNTIHDIPRKTAYEMAVGTLETLLRENPDAELVIDLHRDGVDRSATTGTLNGQTAARILFVVGTRYHGYEENLRKAQFLHQALEDIAPGISRGIRERPFIYNQNYHSGSLLIELGSHENSLEEARLTLPVLAEALNRLYKSGS